MNIFGGIAKCDLVAGFTEYFDDLDQTNRSQVWGVTMHADIMQMARDENPGGAGYKAKKKKKKKTKTT